MGDDAAASTLPAHNAGYLQRDYWEARFQTEAEYEWFKGCAPQALLSPRERTARPWPAQLADDAARGRRYEAFRHLVERECRPDDRILVVGCGNSRMSEGATCRRPCAAL